MKTLNLDPLEIFFLLIIAKALSTNLIKEINFMPKKVVFREYKWLIAFLSEWTLD